MLSCPLPLLGVRCGALTSRRKHSRPRVRDIRRAPYRRRLLTYPAHGTQGPPRRSLQTPRLPVRHVVVFEGGMSAKKRRSARSLHRFRRFRGCQCSSGCSKSDCRHIAPSAPRRSPRRKLRSDGGASRGGGGEKERAAQRGSDVASSRRSVRSFPSSISWIVSKTSSVR